MVTLKKKHLHKSDDTWCSVYLVLLAFLLSNSSFEGIVIWLISQDHEISWLFTLAFNFCRILKSIFPFGLGLLLFVSAMTPGSHLLSLIITLILCRLCVRKIPNWVFLLFLMLANDIEFNPGPRYHEGFFSFMNWNLNSLVKNNFERVKLIEAHNSLFNYDIISLCETGLNASTEIPDPLLNDYTFISANHKNNASHGGVGLFFKNSLPLTNRSDIAFNESIVVELNFRRKKIFFIVVYRSPSFKQNTP